MKRDMDLVKAILLKLEENAPGASYKSDDFEMEGFTSEQVHFHTYLLEEFGLIHALNVTGAASSGPEMIPLWLTWDGYEFLDVARNDGIWNKAKGMLTEKGLGMTFDILKPLLLDLAKESLGIRGS